MKILVAVTSHLSFRLIEGQIKYLTQKGHEVYFVSSYFAGIEKSVESEGGYYYAIDMEREISPIKDFVSLIKIVLLLYKIKPDIINASTPKAGLLFMIASKLSFTLKLKTIFTLRGLRSDTLKGLKYKLVKTMETLTCYLADKVLVISPSLNKHAIEGGILKSKKSIVIGKGSSNGINIERFTNNTALSQIYKLKEMYNIPQTSIVYGYVGRIVRDKGVVELYEGFCKLQSKHADSFLLLIGSYEEADGVSAQFLKEVKGNANVLLLEYTPHIECFFPLMDVFILFSYREGFGNVVLEAASMRIPAIVSDIPGLKDTIENRYTGLLAQVRNSNDLAEKMERFYLDRYLINEYGENARVRVEKFFRNEFIWKGLEELYNELNDV